MSPGGQKAKCQVDFSQRNNDGLSDDDDAGRSDDDNDDDDDGDDDDDDDDDAVLSLLICIIVEHLLYSLCQIVLLVFGAYLDLRSWLIITPESSVYKTLCLRKNYFTECQPKLHI